MLTKQNICFLNPGRRHFDVYLFSIQMQILIPSYLVEPLHHAIKKIEMVIPECQPESGICIHNMISFPKANKYLTCNVKLIC